MVGHSEGKRLNLQIGIEIFIYTKRHNKLPANVCSLHVSFLPYPVNPVSRHLAEKTKQQLHFHLMLLRKDDALVWLHHTWKQHLYAFLEQADN